MPRFDDEPVLDKRAAGSRIARETRVEFFADRRRACRFFVDVFREARERAPVPPHGSRVLAAQRERSPAIMAVDSNRDHVVEFVALRAP
jgi:hypothetical protein